MNSGEADTSKAHRHTGDGVRYHIDLRETAPRAVLRVPRQVHADALTETIADGMNELAGAARRAGLTRGGAPTATFHRSLRENDSTILDFALPLRVAPDLDESPNGYVAIEPAALVARTCHRGGYDGLDAAYQVMREWMNESGYRPIGLPRFAYLVGPDEVGDPRDFVTEILVPIASDPVLAVRLETGFADTIDQTRTALRRQGFAVPAEIDVHSILPVAQADPDTELRILGACHSRLAGRALHIDNRAAILLPCNVVIRSDAAGTVVEVADPVDLAEVAARPALRPIAFEMRRLLTAALEELRDGGTHRA